MAAAALMVVYLTDDEEECAGGRYVRGGEEEAGEAGEEGDSGRGGMPSPFILPNQKVLTLHKLYCPHQRKQAAIWKMRNFLDNEKPGIAPSLIAQ